MTKVSVIIPAYNAAPYIGSTVHSVLAQTEQQFEIIVVDDYSTDDTARVVGELAANDHRIRLLRNTSNRGQAFSRNVGIAAARGDWISLLDADDWFEKDRLAALTGIADAQDAEMVADNQHFVTDEKAKPWRTLFPDREDRSRTLSVIEFLEEDRFGQHGTPGLVKPLIRRAFLAENGIGYDETAATGEDFDFFMKCFANSPTFVLYSRPMYFYRTRPDSRSSIRTIDDLESIKSMNNRLLKLFSGKDQGQIRRLLNLRAETIERFIRYRRIRDPLKAGRILTVLGRSLRDVAIIPFVLSVLSKALWRRTRIIFSR